MGESHRCVKVSPAQTLSGVRVWTPWWPVQVWKWYLVLPQPLFHNPSLMNPGIVSIREEKQSTDGKTWSLTDLINWSKPRSQHCPPPRDLRTLWQVADGSCCKPPLQFTDGHSLLNPSAFSVQNVNTGIIYPLAPESWFCSSGQWLTSSLKKFLGWVGKHFFHWKRPDQQN